MTARAADRGRIERRRPSRTPLRLSLVLCGALVSCADASPPSAAPGSGPGPTPARLPPATAPAYDPSALVLKVGPREVTLGELKQLLGAPPLRRMRETEAQRRHAFLAELERTELLFVRAQRRGYADSAESNSLRKQKMVQLFLEDELAASAPPPSDAELREAYAASDAQFRGVEQVRARHVLVRDRARARALLARIVADASPPLAFERAAREQSLDKATAAIGGDLGYLTLEAPAADVVTSASGWPRPVPDTVRRAAFALTRPLEIAREPVTSSLGQHLVMLVARYPARRAELAQVASMLRERISAERRKAAQEKLIEELTSRSHVQRHEENLRLVRSGPVPVGTAVR